MILPLILIGSAVTLLIVTFGVVGFTAFFAMGIVDSSEDLDESSYDDGEDIVWRIGSSLSVMLVTPRACT